MLMKRSQSESIDLNSTIACDFRTLDVLATQPLLSKYYNKATILYEVERMRPFWTQQPDPVVLFAFHTSLGSARLKHLYYAFMSNKYIYSSEISTPGFITACPIGYRHHELESTIRSAVHCFANFLRKSD